MSSALRRVSHNAMIPCLLVWAHAALAQSNPAWVNPPSDPSPPQARQSNPAGSTVTEVGPAPAMGGEPRVAEETRNNQVDPTSTASVHSRESDKLVAAEPTPNSRPSGPFRTKSAVTYRLTAREQAARDFAFRYLDDWSAPNPAALASASSFYGSSVSFHGRTRSFESVLAEKRRFAETWPDRTYRYRPETTQVACEAHRPTCTVWSIFDFAALNPRHGRRSRGIGDHELVVSFSGSRPVIVSENSRVLRRGTAPSGPLGRLAALTERAGSSEVAGEAYDREAGGASASSDRTALAACREAIAKASRPYGGTRVSLANAESPAVSSVGTSLSFEAQIDYRDGPRHEVRNAHVTCRLGEDGQVLGIQ